MTLLIVAVVVVFYFLFFRSGKGGSAQASTVPPPETKQQQQKQQQSLSEPEVKKLTSSRIKKKWTLPFFSKKEEDVEIRDIFRNRQNSCWLNTILSIFIFNPGVYQKISFEERLKEIDKKIEDKLPQFGEYVNFWFAESQFKQGSVNFLERLLGGAEPLIEKKEVEITEENWVKELEERVNRYIAMYSESFRNMLREGEIKDGIFALVRNILQDNRQLLSQFQSVGNSLSRFKGDKDLLFAYILKQHIQTSEMGLHQTSQETVKTDKITRALSGKNQRQIKELIEEQAHLEALKVISNILKMVIFFCKDPRQKKILVDYKETMGDNIFYIILGSDRDQFPQPTDIFITFRDIANTGSFEQKLSSRTQLLWDFQGAILAYYSEGNQFQSSIFLSDLLFFPGFDSVKLFGMPELRYPKVIFDKVVGMEDLAAISIRKYNHYYGLIKNKTEYIEVDDLKTPKKIDDPKSYSIKGQQYGLIFSCDIFNHIPMEVKKDGRIFEHLNYIQWRIFTENPLVATGGVDPMFYIDAWKEK